MTHPSRPADPTPDPDVVIKASYLRRLRAIEAAARAAAERWLAEDAKGLDGAMTDLTAELR